jgi:RNA polymerase sigma-70 factor (ECF subfamily)
MNERDWLADRMEEHGPHLRTVAYRMLGSADEADDAVQEAWLRLSRVETDEIANLRGWLTTVVARVCLDMLRSRRSRSEEPLDEYTQDHLVDQTHGTDPEAAALMADALGPALLVVLETLAPAERVAFVLHDVFDVPFDEIAPIVERTPAAARQLASRARRRVRGATAETRADLARQRQIVEAFLAAAQGGDFEGLLALLHPDVVIRADAAGVRAGAPAEVRGAEGVARLFAGRARGARLALIDGAIGFTWAPGGRPRVAILLTIAGDRIKAINSILDPETLARLDVTLLPR